VMSAYMKLPSDHRCNDLLNRKIILTFNKKLSKYPLIRFQTTIPFWTIKNVYASVLWATMKKSFVRKPSGIYGSFRTEAIRFLHDYILDRLASNSVKTYPYYNFGYIERSIHDYYRGKNENIQVIEDWLTFDFWREHTGTSNPHILD
jgi:hypothetical protein